MKDIAIFGFGGFGKEVLSLIEDINKVKPTWNVIGFFDDQYSIGYESHGLKNLGGIREINKWDKSLAVTIAIGTPHVKKNIIDRIHNELIEYPTLIHPTVIIGNNENVRIGKGCILCANCIITCDVEIHDFVTLNLLCTVGHDTVIKDFCAFMPSCSINGECVIEEGVYCGAGVKTINQTAIGANTIVGAGAVVTKPLPENCTAVGVPAKPIKFHDKSI